MPSLTEIKKNKTKKFTKKPYRIWNLSGENNPALPNSEKPSLKNKKSEKVRGCLDNNQTSIRQQTDNAQETDRQQTDNKQTMIGEQTDNNQKTNRQQLRQHLDDKNSGFDYEETSSSSIKKLSGLQEKLFYLILEHCNINGELQTDQLITNKIAENINCSYKSAKTTIERLVKKGVVERLKGKSSKVGFVCFGITREIKVMGNRLKLRKENLDVNFGKYLSGIRQQLGNTSDNDYNSSSINIKTTTNRMLSEDWRNIDIEPLAQIGFNETHLSQIASKNKLSPQMVQDSIYAFAFDIQENGKREKIKGDPINFFMGIFRKGEPYVPPSNYESPQDKSMRLYQERMQEIENERNAREKKSKDLAYNDWFSKLTDDQKREYLPANLRRGARIEKNKMLEGSARNHFEEEVWPNLKMGIIQETSVAEQKERR